jgi:hypothetical protein
MSQAVRCAPSLPVAPVTPENAGAGWLKLLQWHQQGTKVAFVYSRSLGGLMQTGHCRLARLVAEFANLESSDCKLMVALSGARYELGPQKFFTANLLGSYFVNGVAVQLANHDWLFLSDEASPTQTLIPGGR